MVQVSLKVFPRETLPPIPSEPDTTPDTSEPDDKPEPDKPAPESGSSGCDVGFSVLSVLVLMFAASIIARRKK